ncbi:CIC11C00000002934 [Sungouiella intermedia]|uniref:CIC11C00000002934 n=1 Tax=Sungouiella intermedia TaxID=45354 RepID=A0A1L0BQY8_9ASCO|nr:CIC11C00000002934 [[Candida] intermedia]
MGLFRLGANPGFRLDMARLSHSSELPSDSDSLRPLASPAYEDVPMWNILPSYQLYESTFSKNIDPLSEDLHGAPPLYEATSPPSTPGSGPHDYFSQPSAPNRWENSILANTHRLKQLSSFASLLADLLKVDVFLTTSPGRRGVSPTLYDGQDYEFLQGDLIHGYVTIINVSSQPLPFDMFSVVFEGRVTVNGEEGESKKPIVFYKFLNMFDFRASWTPAYLDDTISDLDAIDPTDGTSLMFPTEKLFAPGVKYKKFFNFTIPDKLLDCACEVHELDQHCKLLPSVGLDKEQFLQRLRKLREKPTKPQGATFGIGPPTEPKPLRLKRGPTQSIRFRDFCFPDTAISYCVEARVVGKLSDYGGSPDSSKDEYIMVKESNAPVRMIPRTFAAIETEAVEDFYEKFVHNIQNCIALGKQLELGVDPLALARRGSVAKNGQLYTPVPHQSRSSGSQVTESFLPYKKKLLAQAPKVLGMLSASTPKADYVLLYSPLTTMSTMSSLARNKNTKLRIPVTVRYSSSDLKNGKPPEIKGVGADIVACTIRSKKYPIPVEFPTSVVVGNGGSNDGFEKNVIQPFTKQLKEVLSLSQKMDPVRFDMSNQTIMDIKSLAHLGVKYNNLRIDDVVAKSDGKLGRWNESKDTAGSYYKEIVVEVDIKSLFAKDRGLLEDVLAQPVCLVPSFQSCIVSRFYYITVYVKFVTGDPLAIKVAVEIKNMLA